MPVSELVLTLNNVKYDICGVHSDEDSDVLPQLYIGVTIQNPEEHAFLYGTGLKWFIITEFCDNGAEHLGDITTRSFSQLNNYQLLNSELVQ